MKIEKERIFGDSEFIKISRCPMCSSKHVEVIGTKRTIHPNSRLSVRIICCCDCSHWFTDPMPKVELLMKLYAESSLTVLGENWASGIETNNQNQNIAPDSNWIVKDLSNAKTGNYLEVGPGDGSLLRKIRQLGWNGFGIDLGSYACGFQVYSQINHLPSAVKYDVIVFQDVLEHVSDPIQELSNYVKLLETGGLVFMTFPWSESKRAKLSGTRWDMVRPLGHLHYFSMQSATNLLKSHGLDVLGMEPVNLNGSTFDQIIEFGRSIRKILSRIIRPSKWHDLRPRIDRMIMLLKSFPDNVGDQLYIKAKKI